MDIRVFLLLLPVSLLMLGHGQPGSGVRHFNDERPGVPPTGFTLASMRQASAGTWTVERIAANGYLVHASHPSHAGGFSLALAPDQAPAGILVSARLRLTGGARAGGVVWGYVDANHYSAVVLDLARAELVLYRVVDGNRVRVETEDDLELDPDAWHTLKVVSDDNRVTVSLGGIRVFQDDRRTPRPVSPMKAGVLAAGDADVFFDDLRIEPAPDRRRR